ncbi:hypothetical protein AB5J55_40780 [Streptomyces sp. R11]|uniref:Uncharacterized protein n=1 Tax=Streptomyces sp. R11 TaxID=3238625 RepID=A0AB39NC26_9ACTN
MLSFLRRPCRTDADDAAWLRPPPHAPGGHGVRQPERTGRRPPLLDSARSSPESPARRPLRWLGERLEAGDVAAGKSAKEMWRRMSMTCLRRIMFAVDGLEDVVALAEGLG